MKHPAPEAANIILAVMQHGSSKDGCDETWRDKPEDYHLTKALRHIITYQMIRDGHQPPDGEDHRRNAITRMAMALCILQHREIE